MNVDTAPRALTEPEKALVAAARELIILRYRPDWHSVAAGVLVESGRMYTGINMDTYLGRAAICAEPVALGRAVSEGEPNVRTVVAVRHPRPEAADQGARVVVPCGICSELLQDYAGGARVIVPAGPGSEELIAVPVRDLAPHRFERHDKPRA